MQAISSAVNVENDYISAFGRVEKIGNEKLILVVERGIHRSSVYRANSEAHGEDKDDCASGANHNLKIFNYGAEKRDLLFGGFFFALRAFVFKLVFKIIVIHT